MGLDDEIEALYRRAGHRGAEANGGGSERELAPPQVLDQNAVLTISIQSAMKESL